MAIWKIFRPTREVVKEGGGEGVDWHNEELHDLYCSQNIIRMIKSRGIRLAKCVGGMRKNRNTYRFWCVNLKDRHVLQDMGVGEVIILK